jgi:hypothetical protein
MSQVYFNTVDDRRIPIEANDVVGIYDQHPIDDKEQCLVHLADGTNVAVWGESFYVQVLIDAFRTDPMPFKDEEYSAQNKLELGVFLSSLAAGLLIGTLAGAIIGMKRK